MQGRLSALVIGIVLVSGACGGSNAGRQMDVSLRGVLEHSQRPGFVTADEEGVQLWKQTRQFYEQREFLPAWIENAVPRRQMADLIGALQNAGREGLDPELYSAALIEERRTEATKGFLTDPGFDPDEAGRLDVWLTYLYLKHAADLANGISDMATADRRWHITPETFDPLAHLTEALDRNRISDSLADLLPTHREYTALRDALGDYRERADAGGWPEVPGDLRLTPGQTHKDVPALARRLAASGDYTGGEPVAYDEALQDAVKRFQARHGRRAERSP